MNDLALLVKLQARVATFLADLPTHQLLALIEGRASLAVLDAGSPVEAVDPPRALPTPAPAVADVPRQKRSFTTATRGRTASVKAEPINAEAIVAQLRAAETIDEATALLAGLNLRVADLKLVAQQLSIPVSGAKPELLRRILNLTVGSRSKHAGLRQG